MSRARAGSRNVRWARWTSSICRLGLLSGVCDLLLWLGVLVFLRLSIGSMPARHVVRWRGWLYVLWFVMSNIDPSRKAVVARRNVEAGTPLPRLAMAIILIIIRITIWRSAVF